MDFVEKKNRFLSLAGEFLPVILTVALFLLVAPSLSKFDPFTLAHDRTAGNLIQEIKIRQGDNQLWASKNLVEGQEWKTFPWNEVESLPANEPFWIRSYVEISQNGKENRDLALFIGGIFAAKVYWNGTFAGTNSGPNDENPLFLSQMPISGSQLQMGKNTLAIKIVPKNSSLFLHPRLQVLSLNAVEYTTYDFLALNFILGFIFLTLLLGTILFTFFLLRQNGDKKQNSAFILAGILLLGDFVYWILADIHLGTLDLYIFFHALTLTGGLIALFVIPEIRLNQDQKYNLNALFLVSLVALYSLFLKKSFPFIYLILIGVFLGYAVFKTVEWKLSGNLLNTGYIFGLAALPLLAVYKPFLMANVGVYLTGAAIFLPFLAGELKSFLKSQEAEKKKTKYLDIYAKGQKHLIDINKIKSFSAVGHYTEIQVEDQNPLIYQHGITGVLKRLPENFVRVHRSHAVNIRKVQKVNSFPGSRYSVTLSDGRELPVGRTYIKKIMEKVV